MKKLIIIGCFMLLSGTAWAETWQQQSRRIQQQEQEERNWLNEQNRLIQQQQRQWDQDNRDAMQWEKERRMERERR
jgi:hypothetical protein